MEVISSESERKVIKSLNNVRFVSATLRRITLKLNEYINIVKKVMNKLHANSQRDEEK
jgi:hypothetical protein